ALGPTRGRSRNRAERGTSRPAARRLQSSARTPGETYCFGLGSVHESEKLLNGECIKRNINPAVPGFKGASTRPVSSVQQQIRKAKSKMKTTQKFQPKFGMLA